MEVKFVFESKNEVVGKDPFGRRLYMSSLSMSPIPPVGKFGLVRVKNPNPPERKLSKK
jgi:hypothetical protein